MLYHCAGTSTAQMQGSLNSIDLSIKFAAVSIFLLLGRPHLKIKNPNSWASVKNIILCLKRHRTQSSHSSSQPTSHPVTLGIQMISHHLVIASRLLLLVVQKALMEHQSAYERSFANYCNLCIAARCSKFCQPVELIEKFIKQNSIFWNLVK